MKLKFFILSLAIVITSSAFGNTPQTPIKITVPFINKTVNSPNYQKEGLTFDYQTNNGTQKVICLLSHLNDAWLEYSENGLVQQPSTHYNSTQTIILTSKGTTQHISSNLDQYHVDPESQASIFNTDNPHTTAAFATCLYAPEDS